MNRLFCCAALLVTGAGLLAAEGVPSKDEAAIRSQLAGYFKAREAGPGHAQALFYTEDADEWGSGAMEMTVGRAALEKTLDQKPDPNRHLTMDPMHFTFIGKDVALVDAIYGTAANPRFGHAMYIMVKHDGKWLIRSARITRFPVKDGK